MIDSKVYTFLADLENNNNREWFNSNKKRYLEAKLLFDNYIGQLIPALSSVDPEIKTLEPKDCVFRIYKDTRFSKDGLPYKTNFGAYMAKGGRKSRYAGYYIHVEPRGSFIGGGIHMPENDVLKAIRTEIYEDPSSFISLIEDEKFVEHYNIYSGDKLKTAPKGYPKDWEYIELLKNKSFTFFKDLTAKELESNKLTENLIEYFTLLKPVNDWFNNILVNMGDS